MAVAACWETRVSGEWIWGAKHEDVSVFNQGSCFQVVMEIRD